MDDDDNKLITSFYNKFLPLEHLIYNKDNQFFYVDHSQYWKKSSYQGQLFNKINTYWEQLDDKNRSVVWDYISVLFNLAKQFCVKGN